MLPVLSVQKLKQYFAESAFWPIVQTAGICGTKMCFTGGRLQSENFSKHNPLPDHVDSDNVSFSKIVTLFPELNPLTGRSPSWYSRYFAVLYSRVTQQTLQLIIGSEKQHWPCLCVQHLPCWFKSLVLCSLNITVERLQCCLLTWHLHTGR